VSLLLDVLQIIPRRPAGGILLAHVTQTAGKLRQPLAVGALAKPFDPEVIGLEESRTGEKSEARLCIDQLDSMKAWEESGRKLR
jgi:hypothetical protein